MSKPDASQYDATDSNDLAALKYFESFDTSIDSTASPASGTVIGAVNPGGIATTVTSWMDTGKTIKALGYRIR